MGKETIVIERVGPFGVMVDGVWFGLGKKSELTPDNFEKGETYDVLTSESDSGKKYINKVLQSGGSTAAVSSPSKTEPPVEAKQEPPKKSFSGGYDSPEKNERILRQGVYQHVAVSPAIVPFILKEEDYVPTVTRHAEALITAIKG